MKSNFKILSTIIVLIIMFFSFLLIKPNVSYADWTIENVSASNLVIRDGILSSFDLQFDVPDYLGKTTSWVGIQTKMFEDRDLKDNGTVFDNKEFSGIDAVEDDASFKNEYGIEAFSNKDGFPCFGPEHSSINTSFSGMNVSTTQNGVYYIYLWTVGYGRFYPDILVGTLTINDGIIKIADHNNNELIVGDANDFEAETIEKIEIEGANISSIKVGERPLFTGSIKDYSDGIKLYQTFMSLGRESTITNDIESSGDVDGLIKNYKYFYIADIIIKDNANLKFNENTKVYINGNEINSYYDGGVKIIAGNEDNVITPEGYIEPAALDEEFEIEQNNKLEKDIIQYIKEGKVKYREEGIEQTIQNAITNGSNINIEINISKAISESTVAHEFGYNNIINGINSKISENQKLGAYYAVNILVYVDGYFTAYISELPTPISITVPLANGLPKVADGYERVWNVIRYHNRNVEVLDANQTENGISFMNDKYSEFAAIYEDVKIDNSDETQKTEEVEKTNATEKSEEAKDTEKIEENTNPHNPKTGDNIAIWISLMIISVVGTVGTIIINKYRKKKNLK